MTTRPLDALTTGAGRRSRTALLSTLWIFASLNYIYCDVIGLMDHERLREYLTGTVGGIEFSPGILLGASVLVEIPLAMVLLSRVLPYRINRWANVAAGTLMSAVQVGTLTFGTTSGYYLFFSIVEIATTAFIAWYAWTWAAPAGSTTSRA